MLEFYKYTIYIHHIFQSNVIFSEQWDFEPGFLSLICTQQ